MSNSQNRRGGVVCQQSADSPSTKRNPEPDFCARRHSEFFDRLHISFHNPITHSTLRNATSQAFDRDGEQCGFRLERFLKVAGGISADFIMETVKFSRNNSGRSVRTDSDLCRLSRHPRHDGVPDSVLEKPSLSACTRCAWRTATSQCLELDDPSTDCRRSHDWAH